ncbi:hypothetical protein Esti_002784 [Eimeria stiedai]
MFSPTRPARLELGLSPTALLRHKLKGSFTTCRVTAQLPVAPAEAVQGVLKVTCCLALQGWQPSSVNGSSPQLRLSRVLLNTASRGGPDFLSVLNPFANSAKEDALASASGVLAGREATRIAPIRFSGPPSCSPECPEADGDKPLERPVLYQNSSDLQRLQYRYDMLLRRPQAFAMQVQLLRMRIRRAQQLHSHQSFMRELRPLQDQLTTPGTGACLVVKPVVYAAFCIFNPSCIHVSASARVEAAAHFLGSYLNRKALLKRQRFEGLSSRPPHLVTRVEQWLAHSCLENICVYPLEALCPQPSIFRLSAPLRVAAWEEILGSAPSC